MCEEETDRCGRSSCTQPQKKCRPRYSKNSFLNFLNELRKKHPSWPPEKLATVGARMWCALDACQRKKYQCQALKAGRSSRPFKTKCAPKLKCKTKRKKRACKPKKKACKKRMTTTKKKAACKRKTKKKACVKRPRKAKRAPKPRCPESTLSHTSCGSRQGGSSVHSATLSAPTISPSTSNPFLT